MIPLVIVMLSNQTLTPLDLALKSAAESAIQKFGVKPDEIAITMWIQKGETLSKGAYNGDLAMYPASVVKMFFMAYAHQLSDQKKLKPTPELTRAMTDMIKESSNDATGLILDAITGTTGGPELPEKEMKRWMEKRQSVNRWLGTLGYQGINCSQKTWNEGPYGRERIGYGPNFENRNSLTSNACVKMLFDIMNDKVTTPKQCESMRTLLSRTVGDKGDGQANEYIGGLLPAGTKIWSKAGWTSTVRHDVCHLKFPDRAITISIFTKAQVAKPDLLQFIAKQSLALE